MGLGITTPNAFYVGNLSTASEVMERCTLSTPVGIARTPYDSSGSQRVRNYGYQFCRSHQPYDVPQDGNVHGATYASDRLAFDTLIAGRDS